MPNLKNVNLYNRSAILCQILFLKGYAKLVDKRLNSYQIHAISPVT